MSKFKIGNELITSVYRKQSFTGQYIRLDFFRPLNKNFISALAPTIYSRYFLKMFEAVTKI